MAAARRSSVGIDSAARDRLDTLKDALPWQGLPSSARPTDVVSALILYTPPQQLSGMLRAYWMERAEGAR